MINLPIRASLLLLLISSFSAFTVRAETPDQKHIALAEQLLDLSGLAAHAEALPRLAEATLEQAIVEMPWSERQQIRDALREAFVAEQFKAELLAALLAEYDSKKVLALTTRYRSSSVQDIIQAAQKSLETRRSSRAVWKATLGDATSTSEKRALIEQVVNNSFQKPVNQVMRRTLSSSLIQAKANAASGNNEEVHQDQVDAAQHRYEFVNSANDSDADLTRAIHSFRSVSASQLRAYLLRTRGDYTIWLNEIAADALGDALLNAVRKMQLIIEKNQRQNSQASAY